MNSRRAAVMTASIMLLAGCTTQSSDNASGSDAKRYYDTYEQHQGDDSVSGNSPTGQSATSQGSVGRAHPLPPNTPGSPGSPGSPGDPGLLDDNTFVDAGTSGVIDARRQPRSTFAVDVDTGSYRVARSLLREGQLPPPESVRVEEWVNSFNSHFPAPTRDDLELHTDEASRSASAETSPNTRLVRIGLQGREVTEEAQRPVALTMVVDTSGSMDIRERLGLVKSSLALLVENLRPSDTISIVTYQSNATPLLRPTPVSKARTILNAIDELEAGGSTNLEAGLLLGYDQAREAYREDATNVVVLASDGVANVGVTDGGQLANAIRDNGARGIHLVTVGFGMGNYNDHLMEQLADRGNGFYAYVDTFEEAQRLFVTDLPSTLTPIARDAKIQVEFDPRTVSTYRLIGYENRALANEDFDDPTVDAGEVGAGHRVTALYEVTPTRAAKVGDTLGEVRVRWASIDDGEQRTQALPLRLGRQEPASGTLGVAQAVADIAHWVKRVDPSPVDPENGPPASGSPRRDLRLPEPSTEDLDRIEERLNTLVDHEAPGATEARDLVREVRAAADRTNR